MCESEKLKKKHTYYAQKEKGRQTGGSLWDLELSNVLFRTCSHALWFLHLNNQGFHSFVFVYVFVLFFVVCFFVFFFQTQYQKQKKRQTAIILYAQI